jgi:hypothetical protein
MFLSDDEIKQLTGIKRGHAKQGAYLKAKKIKHWINAKGAPIVPSNYQAFFTQTEFESKTEKFDYQLSQFNGEIPVVWLEKNADKYIFTAKQIVEASIRYPNEVGYLFSGLYFLVDEMQIVYVGIAKNISERLLQHYRSDKTFTHIFTIEFPEMVMPILEGFYIEALRPIYNVKYPPVYTLAQKLLKKYEGAFNELEINHNQKAI